MAPLPYDGTGLKPVKKVATKKAASKKKATEAKDSAQESED